MIATIRKALVAAAFDAVGTLGGVLLDGDLTAAEVLFSVGTGLVAGAATWRVPNAAPPYAGGEHRADVPAT